MDKQKAVRILVFLVIAGLIGSYLQMLFAPKPVYQNNQPASEVPNDQSASLVETSEVVETPSAKPEETPSAPGENGFGGLKEESDSLEDIEKMLE